MHSQRSYHNFLMGARQSAIDADDEDADIEKERSGQF